MADNAAFLWRLLPKSPRQKIPIPLHVLHMDNRFPLNLVKTKTFQVLKQDLRNRNCEVFLSSKGIPNSLREETRPNMYLKDIPSYKKDHERWSYIQGSSIT